MDRELKLYLLPTSGNKCDKGPRLHAGWAMKRYDTEEEVDAIKAKLPKKKKVINTGVFRTQVSQNRALCKFRSVHFTSRIEITWCIVWRGAKVRNPDLDGKNTYGKLNAPAP